MDVLDFPNSLLNELTKRHDWLNDQSFKQLLFGFFAAINLSSCLPCIMPEVVTEIAFQSKQTRAVCVVFMRA